MCSKLTAAFIAYLLFAGAAQAEAPGGHRVDLGVWFGRMFFSNELRFEDDQIFGINASAEFSSWVQLSVAIGQMTIRDSKRDAWSDSVLFEMMWRLRPLRGRHGQIGGLIGVSFMGFEEDEITDAVAEGLDLGLSAARDLTSRWRLTVDYFWRMQQFNLVPVDENGDPTGSRDESSYLWSSMFRGGVSYAF